MTPKLVVCDVDGTLVDKAKHVTDATVAAVRRLEAAGIAFALVSARPRSGMLPVLARLGATGPAAAFNGGLVFAGDEILFHETIDPGAAAATIALERPEDVALWLFADGQWHAEDLQGPHTASERVTADQEPAPLPDPAALADRADKLTFVCDDEPVLRAFAERVRAAIGDAANVVQSQTYYLDVTARAGDKGEAVKRLAAIHGVSLGDVVAIGDQRNDVPMLERAGRGIAMGNAPDDVKAVADAVTLGNDADGVAHAIDHLILNGAI